MTKYSRMTFGEALLVSALTLIVVVGAIIFVVKAVEHFGGVAVVAVALGGVGWLILATFFWWLDGKLIEMEESKP